MVTESRNVKLHVKAYLRIFWVMKLVEYEKEIGLGFFFEGTKNPKQTKRGDAYFQVVSKATKQKFSNIVSFYLKITCYIIDSKGHFFLCEYFNKHVFETSGFATF